MLTLPQGVRVFIYDQPTDLRRSFDRLAAMVREHLKEDPAAGHLYLFRNRSGDRVKVLWHELTGFWIFYHRLHRGVFRFPQAPLPPGRSIEIDSADLAFLLAGLQMPATKAARPRPV
jgi:transposase